MRILTLIFLLLLSFSSCKSSKRISDNSKKIVHTSIENKNSNHLANKIAQNAEAYKGVHYKYGGITSKGMDCSGLIFVSFKEEHILLPRVTYNMAKSGKHIKLKDVVKGDLLFFKTNKNRNIINHVGLVINSKNGFIEFIHSTKSKGVTTSSLAESYWFSVFIEARRVL